VYLRINKPKNIPTILLFLNLSQGAIWEISKKKMLTTEKKKHCRRKIQITNFQNLMGFMSGSGYKKKLGPPTSWFQNMNLVVFPIIFL
jgi:hypothetical protein